MRKNSTIKRTAIALDPDLTRRLKKVLKGRKLSKYTQDAIRKELEIDEMEETKRILKQLTDTDQYHKIKQLEEDIGKLKEDSVNQKVLATIIEDGLKKKLTSFESYSEYMIKHYLPALKRIVKDSHKWLREE